MAYNFKSESEVKEYINNLGIEYRFGCYSEKKPEVCHLLADFLESIKKDYEKAGKVYKTNCDDFKYGKSCLKYGTYSLLGKGSKTSYFKLAYDYFEKGCHLEEPDSCLNQALLLITKNEKPELKQDIIKNKCQLNITFGYKTMAYNFKSESEVKEYINNLGIEYRFGCYSEKKPEVCHLLADFLESIKKDYEKAGKVYKTNCDDFKYGKSCLKYGTYSLLGKGSKTSDFKLAYDYFEKGCHLEEPDSCLNQALLLITKNEKPELKQDIIKGMKLLEKACQHQNGNACYYLSGMYIVGVKKDNLPGSLVQKDYNPEDYQVQKNMEKAFEFATKGCNIGNMYSCANLGQMYAKGEGVEKNEELAEKYKTKASELQKDAQSNKTLTFQEGLNAT